MTYGTAKLRIGVKMIDYGNIIWDFENGCMWFDISQTKTGTSQWTHHASSLEPPSISAWEVMLHGILLETHFCNSIWQSEMGMFTDTNWYVQACSVGILPWNLVRSSSDGHISEHLLLMWRGHSPPQSENLIRGYQNHVIAEYPCVDFHEFIHLCLWEWPIPISLQNMCIYIYISPFDTFWKLNMDMEHPPDMPIIFPTINSPDLCVCLVCIAWIVQNFQHQRIAFSVKFYRFKPGFTTQSWVSPLPQLLLLLEGWDAPNLARMMRMMRMMRKGSSNAWEVGG